MGYDKIIKSTEKFVHDKLIDESTGHDWWHAHRVRGNARLINKTEKGDWFVIELACLLHDIGDRKVINKKNDDYNIAYNFLLAQSVNREVIKSVIYIIKNISFSKSLSNKFVDKSIELQIVQDADRLDALGAIGIARTFAYGGSAKQVLYDPRIKPRKNMSSEEYKSHKTTTLNHFEEKLFLLKNLLNTNSAKEIADERELYMKDYISRFLDEWSGKK